MAAGYRSTCAVVGPGSDGESGVSCWGNARTGGLSVFGSDPSGVVWRGADAYAAIVGCRVVALEEPDGAAAPLIQLQGDQSPVYAPPWGVCVASQEGLRCDEYPVDGEVVVGSVLDVGGDCAVVRPGILRCRPRHHAQVQSLSHYEEPISEVEMTDDHICVVALEGRVYCDRDFPYEVPSTLLAGLDVGRHMWCGLSREDGSIVCFGEFSSPGDELAVPDPPAGSFVEVTVGVAHACARSAEGRIACWGSNSFGPGGT